MSITETLLIFVGAPAAVCLVVYGLVYAGGSRRSKRYRPGRPFDFRPVWFLAAPDQFSGNGRAALPAGARRAELPGAELPGAELPPGEQERREGPAQPGETGGASDRW